MSIGTILCWIAWSVVVYATNPMDGGWLVFFFFYASLGLALLGALAVIGFLLRLAITKDGAVLFRYVKHTFRQGLLFACVSIVLLMLLAHQLLFWWNALLLLAMCFVIDTLLKQRQSSP